MRRPKIEASAYFTSQRLECGHFRSIDNKSNLTAKVKTLQYGGSGNRRYLSRNKIEDFGYSQPAASLEILLVAPTGEKSPFVLFSKCCVIFGLKEAELGSLFMRGKGCALCMQDTTYRI